MYCTKCGGRIEAQDKFCSNCGTQIVFVAPAGGTQYGDKRLTRDMRNNKIAGVCAGLARYLGWDMTLVRVMFLALILFKGLGLLLYVVLWITMPKDTITVQVPIGNSPRPFGTASAS